MNRFKILWSNFKKVTMCRIRTTKEFFWEIKFDKVFEHKILKSIFWIFLTLVFGLLQLWITLFLESNILQDVCFDDEVEKMIKSGAILFFSTAIVASLTIDYFLLRSADFSKSIVGINFVFIPAILLVCCISIFFMIKSEKMDNIHYDFLRNMEFLILLSTCVYAVNIKMKLFNAEKQQKEKNL
ncbi:hypothetical protein QUF74_13050 [Candidatus Halobeggiatoa sp. HSG11]|nr:hypothetical protein [Candidatus Halobeggiatoa sp. HSG11]